MISYHPIYDVNHCAYRLIGTLVNSNVESYEWQQLRLLDFYLVFPHLLKTISPWPREISQHRRLAHTIPSPYEIVQNPRRIAFDALTIQNQAARVVLAKGIFDVDAFLDSKTATLGSVPTEIRDHLLAEPLFNNETFDVIANQLPKVRFRGRSGLRERSGLMEFRYDQ